MKNTVVTYETFHGSARKVAQIISDELGCKCINVDTPFEIENLDGIDNIILVFNFRGPYTAQLTKIYLDRVKEQLKRKNLFLVGEGLFSEKEFPIVADEIYKNNPSKTFNKFFVNGQLRMDILFPEEKVMLGKFADLTGMEIKDMGELDIEKAKDVASKIKDIINSSNETLYVDYIHDKNETETKWVCNICGYIHFGENPPERCPLCGVGSEYFKKV